MIIDIDDENYVFAFVPDHVLERTLAEGLGDERDFFAVFGDHASAERAARMCVGDKHAVIAIDLTCGGPGVKMLSEVELSLNRGVFIDALPGVLTYYEGRVAPSRLDISEAPSPAPSL